MPYTDVLQKNLSLDAARNVEIWLNESKYAEYRDELVAVIEAENGKNSKMLFSK